MYTDWFKLVRLPFRLRPDPDFLHVTGTAARALEGLRHALQHTTGTVTLTGEPGVGKTTLLHVLTRDSDSTRGLARLQVPDLTPQELLDALAVQFGLIEPDVQTPTTATHLKRFFAEEAGEGRRVVILVDDAHELPEATLRALLGFGRRSPAPLVVLAGDRELLRKVRAVTQHGDVPAPAKIFRLARFELAVTRDYVEDRLRIAGAGQRTIFEAEAFAEIQRYTGGTARLINALCDRAMTLAEAHSSPRVGAADIRDAVQALRWVEFAEPVPSQTGDPQPHAPPLHAEPDAAPSAMHGDHALELEVQFRGELVRRVLLQPGRVIVGRHEDADLRLHSNHVSRRHCQIVTTDDASTIEDLGSTNGVVVNGQRLRRHRLAPADTIFIGDHRITCQQVGRAAD